MNNRKSFHTALVSVIVLALYSCANIGNPGGGQIDKTPPIFLRSNPAPNALNADRQKIELFFDEIVTLKDPATKIIVSPAQEEMPRLSASGRKITVELIDSLLPNTTYTIDFSNAVQDNNEGNPLENFAFAFSTGAAVDSLRVSGFVLDSRTLEPMQGVVVGLHSDLADSAFLKKRMERVSLTDDRGQFTVRNVKPGKYRIFALKDLDRDYKFGNPTEDIAFYDSIIVPEAGRASVPDTLYNQAGEIDTIRTVSKPDYRPNDILLSMFNENRKPQYLVNNNRIDSTRISIIFAAPSDMLPTLRLTARQPERPDWLLLERSAGNDTLTYWIRPKKLVSADTLTVAMDYLRTDTLNRLSWTTDTLNFSFRRAKPKKKDKKNEQDSVPEIPFIQLKAQSGGTHEIYAPYLLETGTPVERLDTAAIRLEMKQKQDTVWMPAGKYDIAFRDSTINRRTLAVRTKWESGASYRLTVDSLGITDIYGLFNKTFTTEFKVRELEEYGNLIFSIPAVRDSAFVELLNGSDGIVLTAPVRNHKAELLNLLPAKYYARLVIDRNGNGKYDTGNYSQRLQPEEVYYYPGAVNLKRNWDIEQTWDIYAQPVDKQKPEAIKKNKPERKKWETAPSGQPGEDDNEFNDFSDPNDPNRQFYNQMNGLNGGRGGYPQ